MKPREHIATQITPGDVFAAKVRRIEKISDADRDELTRTRSAIARRTANPDLLQLSESMKELGLHLGQSRSDIMWLSALMDAFRDRPDKYEIIGAIWRKKQKLRQESDEHPSEDR